MVSIDNTRCNGCGTCATICHEYFISVLNEMDMAV